MFNIQRVQKADLDDVRKLAWRNVRPLMPHAFIDHLARSSRNHFWVARRGERGPVVGFIVASLEGNAVETGLLFVVRPDVVGQGVRRALLQRLAQTLEADGVRSLAVHVPTNDAKAIEFHRAAGFSIEGVVETEMGDAVRLVHRMSGPPTTPRPIRRARGTTGSAKPGSWIQPVQ